MTIKLTRCILYKHGRNENINKIIVLTKKSHMSFIKYNFSPDYSRLPPGLLLPIETLLAIRMNLDMNMQTSYCLTGGGGGITPQGGGAAVSVGCTQQVVFVRRRLMKTFDMHYTFYNYM